jgi:flagellar biosynthesis protein FlhA
MPGRQVAVDADLNAGIIDKTTAQQQRHTIHQQADFLGAMDGASKFVRGDAVAGLIITIVNIVGGLVIGILQLGFPPLEAANLFTRLTIGDGLVSQLPALLIALAAGLLVTRSSASTNLPLELVGQLFSRPKALIVAAVFLSLLLLTNLPRMPLILLAIICVGFSLILARSKNKEPSQESNKTIKDEKPQIENLLAVDPLEIEIGVGLIRLADRSRGGDLLERIHHVREKVILQLGLVMPKVRVHDKVQLKANEYQIKISEVVVASGTIHSSTALATALMESIQSHAADLLTRDATKFLIDRLKQTHPVVVKELIPKKISLAEIQQTLQLLLRERLPIRQIGLILEALEDGRSFEDHPIRLTEHVRQRMARTITSRYCDGTGTMQVMQLEATFEDSIREAMHYTQSGLSVNMSPSIAEEMLDQVEVALDNSDHPQPILLVPTDIRPAVRQLTASRLPQLIVLGFGEITNDTQIHTVAMLGEVAMSMG